MFRSDSSQHSLKTCSFCVNARFFIQIFLMKNQEAFFTINFKKARCKKMLNFRMIIESAGRFFSQVSKTSCQSILQQGQIGADYEN